MKKHKSKILMGLFLVALSIILHFIHFAIFRNVEHLFIYLIGDIAFIPLEIFFVSLIFERIIEMQNSAQALKKVYMLIEIFYIELGNKLLIQFSNTDEQVQNSLSKLNMTKEWSDENFSALKNFTKKLEHTVDLDSIDFNRLYNNLYEQKQLLISMISNPALTEHQSFSDTILATFHLLDELSSRDFNLLEKKDHDHLKIDIERAYKGLANDWVIYMEHLSKEYPFLYSKALTSNPFITK